MMLVKPCNPWCINCKQWGDGDGTGFHYDAGNVNYCKSPQIVGPQHPSYGACGEPTSMLITDAAMSGQSDNRIMTRWNFGCVLFELRKPK